MSTSSPLAIVNGVPVLDATMLTLTTYTVLCFSVGIDLREIFNLMNPIRIRSCVAARLGADIGASAAKARFVPRFSNSFGPQRRSGMAPAQVQSESNVR